MMSMATITALKTDLCFRHDLSAYQQCLQHQVLREMEQEVMRNEQQRISGLFGRNQEKR